MKRPHAKDRRALEIQQLIGAEIERRMTEKGMAPAALATAADIDLSQLLKIIAGKSGLSLYSLDRIERALGCEPGEIRAVAGKSSGSRSAASRSAARSTRS